ncbi:conserved protein, unknown function [Plasmodium ovale curtisi]|uniref:Uncharacterized protein n=1 Tax=Plasmodium ovale curtisi TaxID=864141 RepID=A0A1A8VKW4_PLAOA|nr:conserved protein, unknown function [Plasmodium ovale curtisi]
MGSCCVHLIMKPEMREFDISKHLESRNKAIEQFGPIPHLYPSLISLSYFCPFCKSFKTFRFYIVMLWVFVKRKEINNIITEMLVKKMHEWYKTTWSSQAYAKMKQTIVGRKEGSPGSASTLKKKKKKYEPVTYTTMATTTFTSNLSNDNIFENTTSKEALPVFAKSEQRN